MAMIPMRALVPFTHEGTSVKRGDQIAVAAPTAAILRYQHKADFVTITVTPEPARKRRTYKRRDLQAES
jgi:hypothetical protein